jgi:cytochrome P450
MFSFAPWISAARNRVLDGLRSRPAAFVRACGVLSRHPLPPGDLAALDVLEKADRAALRHRADALGPIFKGIAWDEFCVCIVGLERCRRFTQDHRADLKVLTMELEHLIPKGFFCAMEGEDHREIRRATHRAQKAITPPQGGGATEDPVLEGIARDGLAGFVRSAAEHQNSAEAYTAAMSAVATSLLTWTFFGARPGTPEHARFLGHFQELGPRGLVWTPQKRQETAFRAFSDDLRSEVESLRAGQGRLAPEGMVVRMLADRALDETMMGNLIYQVEMARSDMKNLFRWLTRHASDDPEVVDAIAKEDPVTVGGRSLAEAFVLETLRTDQSERMMRRTLRDIVFDGFLIPRHTMVRLCLWESHHAPEAFAHPHRFDAGRFKDSVPGNDTYAPFGVDHHQCPMGGLTIRLGMIFLKALARGYHVTALTPGPPTRGAHHWEPSPRFSVQLTPR